MTNVFDTGAYPALANVHDRTPVRPEVDRVWFGEGDFAQGADFNDAFSTEERKRRQIGNLVASDGDRLSGGDVIVDAGAGTVLITAGSIYLRGAPRAVDAATLTAVPMTGDVELGVRVVVVPVTADDDAIFYGLVPGTESYGDYGAVRTTMSVTWAFDGDGGDGEFYRYALLREGSVISQSAPPTLTGVQKQIGLYDNDAHGNYIVRGSQVTALGLNGLSRIFSVAAGVCNVLGTKVNRPVDNRLEVEEDPDFGTVDLETHSFSDGGSGTAVLTVRRPPIAAINTLIVVKEKTVTLTKGVAGSVDALPDDGVVSIIEVEQLSTTYVAATDYVRNGDAVDWSPGGAEPAAGSSYTVTYRYFDSVIADSFTATTVTVSGGVTGTDVFIGYDYKLPRHDRVLISSDGSLSYLRGLSSPENPHPPAEPDDALSLCVVRNDWYGKPAIDNNGTRSLSFRRLNQLENRLAQAIDMVLLERLKSDANARAAGPTLGIFTDPFWDDSRRDLGEVQDAACFDGTMQLAIEPTVHQVRLPAFGMLDFTEGVLIAQDLRTACEKINPYMNFAPVPPRMTISPASDFWTVTETVTLSDVTRVFGTGNSSRVRSTMTSETVDSERLPFLRPIDVDFEITGLGAGEIVSSLTFDGIDVHPGSGTVVADTEGTATGTFTIPTNVAAGTKSVRATGAAGLSCGTSFRGEGRLETTTVQTTTVLERFSIAIGGGGEGSSGNNDSDPQAQSFALTEGRFVSAVNLWFCKIGDRANPVDVDIVTLENGFPTRNVVATARLGMAAVVTGAWSKVSFPVPVYIPPSTYVALVVRTDDGEHSIAIATLGDFDTAAQKWVSAQPYITGDRFSGSNGETWVAHPDSDLTFRALAPVFSPLTKTINIGSFAAVDVSDILIRADIILPEASCSVVFSVKVGDTTYTVAADQTLELADYFSGTIQVSAVLSGSARVSPVLSPDISVIFGKMKATGRYVGLAFAMGNPVQLDVVFSGQLPTGSSVTVKADANDDTFVAASFVSAVAIDGGFTEYTYRIPAHVAADGGRLELALTGSPAARPAIADLRSFTF